MKFSRTCLFTVLLLSALVMSAFLLSCSKHRSANPVAPVHDPSVFISSLTADPPFMAAADSSVITALVLDADSKPLSGLTVQFSATLGTVEESAITNSAGIATALFRAGSTEGVATITAQVGEVVRNIAVQVGLETGMLTADPASILADGVSTSTVSARLLDENGNPHAGMTVYFYTSCGQITPSATTDGDGTAMAILTSAVSPRDTAAYVTCSVAQARGLLSWDVPGRKTRGLTASGVEVIPEAISSASTEDMAMVSFRGISLSLISEEQALSADGLSSTQLTATLVETSYPHTPVPGLPVSFVSDLGTISPREVNTDADGQAIATLTSGQTDGPATVYAEYQQAIVDSVTVHFQSLSLILSSDQTSLLADGEATASVSALLLNSAGNPVSGASVEFSVNLGSITSPHITGHDGKATATLTSSTNPGACHIVAAFGSSLSDSLVVQFSSYSISLVAEPASILADGADSSQITVILKDGQGHPLADQMVDLYTDLGDLYPQTVVTDNSGRAWVTLTSWISSVDSQAVVTAIFKEGSEQVTVSMRGISLDVSADPTSIAANGVSTCTITASLKENTRGYGIASREIGFATNLGTLSEPIGITDQSGEVAVTLISSTSSGMAVVTASYGNVTSQTEVSFTSGQASNIVLVSVTACSIGVQGSGDNETSTITFEVRDDSGTPLDLSQQVQVDFEIVGSSAGGEFVQPASDLTDASGWVQTTLNSGTVAKTVKVKASIEGLGVSSEAISIAIHGGPPDLEHFSVVPQYANIAGWKTYGLQDAITAFVGDKYGNPVPQGTSIYFSTTGGIIEGSATTDALGRASVALLTADPLPVFTALDPSTGYTSDVSGYCDFTNPKNGDGQAIVFAQTVDELGHHIWTWTPVIFSGCSAIFNVNPITFNIPNGGSQAFTFWVHDLNGNPLTQGTKISVSASVGVVLGDVDVTIPDARSADWTSFSFVLFDDEAGESDPANSCVVTISVTSEANGNTSTIIVGTLD
jgi:adhesin/invasin